MKSINVVQAQKNIKGNVSSELVKKDGFRPQRINRVGKIYEISRGSDSKNITSNNFVMPKIININI